MVLLTPARERATLLVLAAVQFTHVIDFMIMMPLGPLLMRSFGIGPDAFAKLVASYGFSAGASGILATFVLDRFDRKRALLVLYSGFALATLACALAGDYNWLMLARIMAGAFGGVAGSVVTAMVGDVVPQERRGRGMGVVMSGFALAQIFGVPVGLWLATRFDWHAPFYALSAVGLGVAVSAVFILPSLRAHLDKTSSANAWTRVREIATEPNHLRSFGLIIAITMSGMIMVPFLAPSLVFNAGISDESVILVYMLGGIVSLFANIQFGRWGDRFGHVRVFTVMAVVSIVPVVLVTNIGHWPLPVILTITTAFMISMGGRWIPTMALVTMSVRNRLRGGFMSLNSAIQALAGAVAARLAGGIVREAPDGRLLHYAMVGFASLVCIAVGAVIIRRIRVVDERATPRPPAPESGAMD